MARNRAVWLLARLLGNDYPVKPHQIDFLAEQLDEIERNARLDERVKVAESQDWSQTEQRALLNRPRLKEAPRC